MTHRISVEVCNDLLDLALEHSDGQRQLEFLANQLLDPTPRFLTDQERYRGQEGLGDCLVLDEVGCRVREVLLEPV